MKTSMKKLAALAFLSALFTNTAFADSSNTCVVPDDQTKYAILLPATLVVRVDESGNKDIVGVIHSKDMIAVGDATTVETMTFTEMKVVDKMEGGDATNGPRTLAPWSFSFDFGISSYPRYDYYGYPYYYRPYHTYYSHPYRYSFYNWRWW